MTVGGEDEGRKVVGWDGGEGDPDCIELGLARAERGDVAVASAWEMKETREEVSIS